MNNACHKNVSISGKIVITDWRKIRIVSPENFQGKIKANENAKNEIKKQKTEQSSSNSTIATL